MLDGEIPLRMSLELVRSNAEAPGKWADRLNRGVVLHQLGRYAEAIPDYEAARELSAGKADVKALLDDATRRSRAQPPR